LIGRLGHNQNYSYTKPIINKTWAGVISISTNSGLTTNKNFARREYNADIIIPIGGLRGVYKILCK
jgi:hypothetical protein